MFTCQVCKEKFAKLYACQFCKAFACDKCSKKSLTGDYSCRPCLSKFQTQIKASMRKLLS